MTSAAALHVVPDRLGGWHVQREGEVVSLSDHDSATDAERAAVSHARQSGAESVMVHDRYERVHRAEHRDARRREP